MFNRERLSCGCAHCNWRPKPHSHPRCSASALGLRAVPLGAEYWLGLLFSSDWDLMILRIVFAFMVVVWGLVPGVPLHAQTRAQFAAMRHYYLEDLIRPHNYVPGKNSFLLQNVHRGEKKNLLELTGHGWARHIWSTWSIPGDDSDIPAPHRVLMRIFVDGDARPSITGFLDELCRAAEATGSRFVPLPAFNYKGAFNFYLPIYFDRGIRVEIEATDEVNEFYAQIDYRTEKVPESASRLA